MIVCAEFVIDAKHAFTAVQLVVLTPILWKMMVFRKKTHSIMTDTHLSCCLLWCGPCVWVAVICLCCIGFDRSAPRDKNLVLVIVRDAGCCIVFSFFIVRHLYLAPIRMWLMRGFDYTMTKITVRLWRSWVSFVNFLAHSLLWLPGCICDGGSMLIKGGGDERGGGS